MHVRDTELTVTKAALLEREEMLKGVKSKQVSSSLEMSNNIFIISDISRLSIMQSQVEATHQSNFDLQKELAEIGRREALVNQAYTLCNTERSALEERYDILNNRMKETEASLGKSRETYVFLLSRKKVSLNETT